MSTTTPWRIRAVQLDLARQRETIPAIGEFIRFAKDWGYNTLVLYLEGVVRTESFPHRPNDQIYSPDDMRRVVEMAAKAGLEVVPCVSTLGHVEHFTTCREFYHLREDARKAPHMFCPSNPRVYEFLERYLGEIAGLFPSRQFHIGCDEAWGLGSCPACRPHAREDLTIRHIRRVREMLQTHGKRVWIWDDMFENAPESKIAELPRDIVLCAWNYSSELMDRDGLQGHFNNLDRRDWFDIYERLGFDMLICPWTREIENIRAFTEMARGRRVLGGLMTNWEMSGVFLPSVLPGTALGGALWSRPRLETEAAVTLTLRRLFPNLDATARDAVRASLIQPLWWPSAPVQYHLRGPLTLEESRHLQNQRTIEQILAAQLRRLRPGRARDMIEELHALVRLQILAGRQRETLPGLIDPRRPRPSAPIALGRELDALARLRARQWRRYRPGIGPDHASAHLRRRAREFRSFLRTARQANALLQVRLFLWESYSAPHLKIELGASGQWREVYRGSFKPVNQRDAQYTLQVPVRWRGRLPHRARFTISGFGGQGISYAALHWAGQSLRPSAVTRHRGRVVNARAILKDDATVCFLGATDTVRTLEGHRDNEESVVELTLKKGD